MMTPLFMRKKFRWPPLYPKIIEMTLLTDLGFRRTYFGSWTSTCEKLVKTSMMIIIIQVQWYIHIQTYKLYYDFSMQGYSTVIYNSKNIYTIIKHIYTVIINYIGAKIFTRAIIRLFAFHRYKHCTVLIRISAQPRISAHLE